MGYLITTTRTVQGGYTVPGERETLTDVTRRAVATLDEARAYVRPALDGVPYSRELHAQCDAVFAHDGRCEGTIGPLPDGTMIEVTPHEYAGQVA